MDLPVRTVLVGVGARGKVWARLLHDEPRTELVGYVDPVPANLEWVQTRFGATPAVCFAQMPEALRALTPDFVVLATPPMDRYREVLAVFEGGAHLLSEKPLTLDLREAVRIVEAAEQARRGLALGVNFRYQHCVTRAREILKSGEIGAANFAHYIYCRNRDGYLPRLNKYPLTMHQPMLYEQTIHHVDELRFVYDAEVEHVWCRCHNPRWSMYEGDATVIAILEMTGDLVVNYFGTWAAQTKMDQFLWRTECDRGALLQHAMFSDLRIARGTDAQTAEPIALPVQEQLVDDARLLLADVITQLAAGSLRPEPSGMDHLKTLGVVAACEASSRTGRRVAMREFFEEQGVPPRWV
ncbi:MAG TPA: Gfo/Idh/MocA family oxidoreductase [bacterium]|nr:Gfo/Idh/MocA family oxidoreductase [bacterium]